MSRLVLGAPVRHLLIAAVLAALGAARLARAPSAVPLAAAELAVPNDNRVPGGTLAGGVRQLRLVARLAAWHPTHRVDSQV